MRDEPTFPTNVPQIGSTGYPTGKMVTVEGLTKREHFAALALAGLCAAPTMAPTPRDVAIDACALADALIKLLEETR